MYIVLTYSKIKFKIFFKISYLIKYLNKLKLYPVRY